MDPHIRLLDKPGLLPFLVGKINPQLLSAAVAENFVQNLVQLLLPFVGDDRILQRHQQMLRLVKVEGGMGKQGKQNGAVLLHFLVNAVLVGIVHDLRRKLSGQGKMLDDNDAHFFLAKIILPDLRFQRADPPFGDQRRKV